MHGLPGSEDAVVLPYNAATRLHLLVSLSRNLGSTAYAPRNKTDAIGENHNTLSDHTPQSNGKITLVGRATMSHGKNMRRVIVHNHALLRISS